MIAVPLKRGFLGRIKADMSHIQTISDVENDKDKEEAMKEKKEQNAAGKAIVERYLVHVKVFVKDPVTILEGYIPPGWDAFGNELYGKKYGYLSMYSPEGKNILIPVENIQYAVMDKNNRIAMGHMEE